MNKYQKLASNTLIFAIGSFGAKFLSFILMRLYTGCLTSAEYNTADILYQTVNVLYPLVTLSMADAVIRFGMEKAADKRQVYTVAIYATVVGLAVLALFMPAFNFFDMYKEHSFLLYVYCYFSCLKQVTANFVRAKGYVKLFALDGIISTLLIVVCNLIFLLCFDMGVTGYVLSIILSDALSFAGLTFVAGLHKYLDITYFNKSMFKEMLKYSAPLILTYVMWWITSASDRWFVTTVCGGSVSGVYSASYKIPSLLMMVTTLFYQAWQMSAIENRNDGGLAKFYTKIYGAYSSVMLIAAAGIIMIVKPLTFLLVGSKHLTYTLVNYDTSANYAFAYRYTPILVIASVFQCLCQFSSSVYSVKKKSVNACVTSVIAGAVNIALNWLFICKLNWGAYGAAIATAAAYLSCFIVRIFDVTRLIKFRAYHIRNTVSVLMAVYMAYAAITEPKLKYLQIIPLFIIVTLLNFGAVISTVKKVFARRKQQQETR